MNRTMRFSCLNTTLAALSLTLLLSAGCAKNPADNVTPADVKPVGASTNTAPSPTDTAAARTYKIAEDSSTIQFTGSKVTGKHNGGFKKFSGQFNLANGKLVGSNNRITIDMSSIYTDTDRLTGHLKSPDFFNVQKFPQAVFEPTTVEGGEGGKVKITGNLTLHGVTKQISFPADLAVQDNQANLKAEFFIKRFDFDVRYPGKANDLIRDEVVIKLDVKATAA